MRQAPAARIAAVVAVAAAACAAVVLRRGPAPAPRCPPLRAHCGGGSPAACETDLAADPAHCGACGVACAAGVACVAGRCAPRAVGVAAGGARAREAVHVEGLPPAMMIAAAGPETCAVAVDHTLRCWGKPGPEPAPDAALLHVEPVEAVESVVMTYPDVCVVSTAGTVACREARAGLEREVTWKPASGLSGVASLSLVAGDGGGIGYARLRTGSVTAFVVRDAARQATVDGLHGVRALGAGQLVCVATEGGALCFGHDEVARALAAGEATARPRLVATLLLAGARLLGDGVAIDAGGRLIGWAPRPVGGAVATFDLGFEGATRLAQAPGMLCALRAYGRAACRGPGSFEPVAGTQGAVDIAVGGGHGCVLIAGGLVRCWGDAPAAGKPPE